MEELPGGCPSCSNCHTSLAYDQRYCLECGARRGPLPRQISQMIGGIRERGGGVPVAGRREPPTSPRPNPGAQHPHWYDAWAQAPRAAAAAVLSTLGFGAVVGSLVGGGIASPLHTVLVSMPPASANAASADGAAGQNNGSPAGQTIIEQQTITQPGSGATGGVIDAGLPGGGSTGTGTTPAASGGSLPPIKHVFVIALSNQGFQQTFGHTQSDPYLGQTLARKGLLIPNYYAVAQGQLANQVAMIGGQGPTPETVENCPVYAKIAPGRKGAKGQVLGDGCVYPRSADSVADQLTAAKLSWKVYLQRTRPVASPARVRLATTPTADARTEFCRPKPGSPAAVPTPQNPYAAWRNPFLYFDSVVGTARCPKNDVALSQLAKDLRSRDRTPSLSWIVADTCDDGDAAGTCRAGQPTGMAAADAFLESVVPKILASPAYQHDGMIVITFDQAPQTGPTADHSSCCDTPTYPNDPDPGPGGGLSGTPATGATPATGTETTSPTPTLTTPTLGGGQTSATGGGGQVGMLILSRYVAAGQQDTTDYFNHFSLLGSIEELFGLKRLGYAHGFTVATFGAAVFSKYIPGS